MQKYKETLEALPERAVVMYTDGGYQYVEPKGAAAYELCGWGVSIRLRMRRYPNKEERERHGWRTEDIQTDIAGDERRKQRRREVGL